MEEELTLRAGLTRYRLTRRGDAGSTRASRLVGDMLDDEAAFARDGALRLAATLGVPAPGLNASEDVLRAHRARLNERLEARGVTVFPLAAGMHVVDQVEHEPIESAREELEWIEVHLVDEDGEPVAGVEYVIELTDKRVRRGRSNASGIIRYDRLPGGDCKIRFPRLEPDWWKVQ